VVCCSSVFGVSGLHNLLYLQAICGPHWPVLWGGLPPLFYPAALQFLVGCFFFLDLGALPWGPGSSKYWEGWHTTHVFFCLGEDMDTAGPHKDLLLPRCPPGWSSWSVFPGHWEDGGATSGWWSVVVWYPPLMPFSEPLPAILQLWFPLFSYVKDRERATLYPSPPTGGALLAAVVRVDGLVQDWGLYPASDLTA
jgi:hypothetical protein